MRYFVLTNDPDHGLTGNYRQVLEALTRNRIKCTLAVHCSMRDDGSDLSKHCYKGETHTLEEPEYRKLMLWARTQGHEIAYHGYSQVSDTRAEFLHGLELFKEIFGDYPKVYVEHGGHPRSHPVGMCKRENLAVEGGDPASPYYIKDIVRDVFRAVWTHDYLLDDDRQPMSLDQTFVERDGIIYFKRSRMYHLPEVVRHLNDISNTIVGYTHFGYRGYQHRSRLRQWLDVGARYESWSDDEVPHTVDKLRKLLDRHNMISLTLYELLEESIRNTSNRK